MLTRSKKEKGEVQGKGKGKTLAVSFTLLRIVLKLRTDSC